MIMDVKKMANIERQVSSNITLEQLAKHVISILTILPCVTHMQQRLLNMVHQLKLCKKD